ncbi:MAG: nicotinamide riboside kinase [Saprospiraceae bacterium]|jgi:nicotinamide riboside kinase
MLSAQVKRGSKISYFLLFMFLFVNVPQISAQTKEIKKQEKRQEKHKKSQEQLEKEGKKRHLEIQDKETRKRMKRSLKEAERRKKGKNPVPWYRRVFRKKPKKKRYKGGK